MSSVIALLEKERPRFSPLEMKFIKYVLSRKVPRLVIRAALESTEGLHFLEQYPNAATVMGSTRSKPGSPEYREAYKIGRGLAEMGLPVITGGGGGIMEAVNKGALDAGGESIGIVIRLPRLFKFERPNQYSTRVRRIKHFFVRKLIMEHPSRVNIFFPGGLGTFDEFFELATLIQTRKIDPVPLLLVDIPGRRVQFWREVERCIKNTMLKEYKTVSSEDFTIWKRLCGADATLRHIKRLMVQGIIPAQGK